MSTYGQFRTDPSFEENGVDLDLGSSGKFTIARAGGANKRFAKRLEALMKPHRRQISAGTLDNEVAENLLRQVYAETVVLGWEGVTDENGQPLEFSVENARKLFADLPDLFRIIQDTAQDAAVFRKTELETDAGN